MVGVEDDQQRVAADRPAVVGVVGDLVAVEQHRQRAARLVVPLRLGHLGALVVEPGDVLAALAAPHLALEEALAAQHRLLAAQRGSAGG